MIAVNLTAPERISRELLEQGLIEDNGRIIGVSSIAGIAGNVGQPTTAASKPAYRPRTASPASSPAASPSTPCARLHHHADTAAVPFATARSASA